MIEANTAGWVVIGLAYIAGVFFYFRPWESDRAIERITEPPELPRGFDVFEPQGADWIVIRVPDGDTYRLDPDRARDLGLLLFARADRYEDGGHDE